MSNIVLNTDSYKVSHYLCYPPKTQYVSSYIESRGGEYDFTLFFGLQMFLENLKAPTRKQVRQAEEILTAHGYAFNTQWYDIADLGYLPVRIQALKEGTVLPTSNALVQIVNTDPRFPWLTSWLETSMLRAVWYPTTVATRSKLIKNRIADSLARTSDHPEQIAFKLHDFGARGVSSEESAGIGGLAHLVNFMGTDTIAALVTGRKYYSESMPGFSIPAAEHSTITSWGRDKEGDAYCNMIRQFGGPGKIYAVVSDSYDIMNAVNEMWGGKLKPFVEQKGGTLVVRPDSGNPCLVPGEVVEALAEKFGTTENSKGFKVLPDCVRVIQGDGISEETIDIILKRLEHKGFAADNIAFGMGGEMLQTMNRDTLKFAMKASAIKLDGGMWTDVYKDPVTDPGKRSKRGRLGVIKVDGAFKTVGEIEANGKNLLENVYVDGKILRHQTLAEIRSLSNEI